MMTFKAIELADRALLAGYLARSTHQACDYNTGNLIAWAGIYKTQYAVVDDVLFIRYLDGAEFRFAFPMGINFSDTDTAGQDKLKAAFEGLYEFCRAENQTFRMGIVEPSMYKEIQKIYPGRYAVSYSRDHADYVYLMEKLRDLSGKKLHSKKNHLNAFFKTYPDWSYEALSDENLTESLAMAKEWCFRNGCGGDPEKADEYCALKFSLKQRAELGMVGGVLRVNKRIVALTLGEASSADSFSIHFEKAFMEHRGAYQAINQLFVANSLGDYTYINREEDTGDPGLRKAKESYRPIFMVEKGQLIENQHV